MDVLNTWVVSLNNFLLWFHEGLLFSLAHKFFPQTAPIVGSTFRRFFTVTWMSPNPTSRYNKFGRENGLKNWALVRATTAGHDRKEMEWSNAWRKGKSLSSGFFQGLIFLLLGSLVLNSKSFQGWWELQPSSFFFLFFFSSFTLGGHFPLYISFSLILVVHLLIIQVTTWVPIPSAAFLNLLWVVANKVILFRGHFFINTARLSAADI